MPIPVTKILLVEDNPGDARLLREALVEIAKPQFELIHRETMAQALEFLAKSKPDVVLLDLGLPDSQGLDTVRQMYGASPDVPVVVLTALDDEALAIRSLREGAQDYLVKGQIDGPLLWHALHFAVERQRVQLEVLNLALIDDLTGLKNRRGFHALVELHAKVAYRAGKPFLLVFVDLDNMKQIKDRFGHQEGNRALVDAANMLKDSVLQSDILARIREDQFAILIVDAAEGSIETFIHRLQQKLDSCHANPSRRYNLSLSIEIVSVDVTQPPDLERLLSQAGALMREQEKNTGYSRTVAKLGGERIVRVEAAP